MSGGEPSSRTTLEQTVRECAFITIAVLALFALAITPAYAAGGFLAIEGASYAAALCLIPAWLVLLAGDLYGSASPMAKVGVAMILRMAFVMGGFLTVRVLRPELGHLTFTIWLLLFYLATLVLETIIMARQVEQDSTATTNTGGPAVDSATNTEDHN